MDGQDASIHTASSWFPPLSTAGEVALGVLSAISDGASREVKVCLMYVFFDN